MSENNSKNSGIGFWGILQIALIVLKLLNKITWSWGAVLFPVWLGVIGLVILLMLFWKFR